MLPCPLIARAHFRLPFDGQPASAAQSPRSFRYIAPLLPYLTIALSSCSYPVEVTTHYCFKSFSCNTYEPPRKCCKQKTYGPAKPFRCNTYKKHGVGVPVMINQISVQEICPEEHRDE